MLKPSRNRSTMKIQLELRDERLPLFGGVYYLEFVLYIAQLRFGREGSFVVDVFEALVIVAVVAPRRGVEEVQEGVHTALE